MLAEEVQGLGRRTVVQVVDVPVLNPIRLRFVLDIGGQLQDEKDLFSPAAIQELFQD